MCLVFAFSRPIRMFTMLTLLNSTLTTFSGNVAQVIARWLVRYPYYALYVVVSSGNVVNANEERSFTINSVELHCVVT